MSQNALDIAKKNDGNRLFSFTYLYPIIMSIGKILCYIRVYSIHISQKTFNFAAENDNNIKLWKNKEMPLLWRRNSRNCEEMQTLWGMVR